MNSLEAVCKPDCYMRQELEKEQLPGPSPAQVCEAAAAFLVMQEVVVGDCPLEQIADAIEE